MGCAAHLKNSSGPQTHTRRASPAVTGDALLVLLWPAPRPEVRVRPGAPRRSRWRL
ncbi:hypothetical protein ACFPRL_26525 [Pseudoclavibacter helvolus]